MTCCSTWRTRRRWTAPSADENVPAKGNAPTDVDEAAIAFGNPAEWGLTHDGIESLLLSRSRMQRAAAACMRHRTCSTQIRRVAAPQRLHHEATRLCRAGTSGECGSASQDLSWLFGFGAAIA